MYLQVILSWLIWLNSSSPVLIFFLINSPFSFIDSKILSHSLLYWLKIYIFSLSNNLIFLIDLYSMFKFKQLYSTKLRSSENIYHCIINLLMDISLFMIFVEITLQ